jgi:hypothetical protein
MPAEEPCINSKSLCILLLSRSSDPARPCMGLATTHRPLPYRDGISDRIAEYLQAIGGTSRCSPLAMSGRTDVRSMHRACSTIACPAIQSIACCWWCAPKRKDGVLLLNRCVARQHGPISNISYTRFTAMQRACRMQNPPF